MINNYKNKIINNNNTVWTATQLMFYIVKYKFYNKYSININNLEAQYFFIS
jgi:hypothetical protein